MLSLALCIFLSPALLGAAYTPPACTRALLSDVEGFMIDLDGTMYGDLSKPEVGMGFIDGAVAFHELLVDSHTPFVYLSDSGIKGSAGVDAKFRALGLSSGAGVGRAWTAGDGLATLLSKRAPLGSRILVLEGTSRFDGQVDSCVRIIRRCCSSAQADSWTIRTELDDHSAKDWAAASKLGEPVFVAYCADDDIDASADGGSAGWSYDALKHATWLLENGATLAAMALDDYGMYKDGNYPQLRLWMPGPSGFQHLLRTASSLLTAPDAASRDLVVGKGGNMGNEFMYGEAMRLLRAQGLGGASPRSVAMVGDTLNTDIAGGQGFGAVTIWLNRTGVHHLGDLTNFPHLRPTCALPSVKELHELLASERQVIMM